MRQLKWVALSKTALSIADVQIISVNGKRLVLVKHDEEFYAFTSKCPHAGADLANGWCSKGYLICPVHRYQYHLKSGRGASGQGDYLKNYPVRVSGDQLFIGFNKPWFRFW